MLTLKKVAVTGGLACGKSTVCSLLGNLGAFVVSADSIVHQLLSSDVTLIAQVIDLLGPTVVVDNQLDRSAIANVVFYQPALLKTLENLLHPAVKIAIEERYIQACSTEGASLFAAEIPLLFECGPLFSSWYDLSLCVVATATTTRERKHIEHFDARSSHQWPWHAKAAYADVIIDNNGTMATLQTAVQTFFRQIAT